MNPVLLATILQLLNNIVKLATGVAIAYYLGTSKSMDSYVIASGFIISMSGLLINTQSSSLIPYISKYDDEKKRLGFVSKVLKFNFIVIGLGAVLISLMAPYVVIVLAPGASANIRASSTNLLRYLAYLLVLSSFISVGEAVLDYYKRYVAKYVLSLLRSTLILMLVLLFIRRFGLQSIVGAHLFSALLPVVYLAWYFKRINVFTSLKTKIFDKELTSYLKLLLPVVFAWFFVWIIKFSDTFLASWMGQGKIAYLNYCQKITMYSGVLTAALSSIYFARLSKLTKDDSKGVYFSTFADGFVRLVIISMIISAITLCCAPLIISIMFERGEFTGKDTFEVASVLRYYVLVIFCAPLGGYLSNVYFSYKKPKYATLYSVISSIVNVILNVIFGKFMGVTGLALASSIAFVVGVVLQFFNLKRVNTSIASGSVLKRLVVPGLICSVASVVSLSGFLFFEKYTSNSIILFVAFLVPFFLICGVSASFNPDLRSLLSRSK